MSTHRAYALQPDRLRRLAFFRTLAPPEIRRLAQIGATQHYADGDFLATEGTRKQRRVLYVILRGELQYLKRVRGARAKVVLTLHAGEVGGFLTFFNEGPSPVSVRCVGRTAVFEIGRRELQLLAGEHPQLGIKVLLALVQDAVRRLETFVERSAATSAWALDLESLLQTLPLRGEMKEG
jgi:CRP-like cAMP-binding protein